MLSPSTLWTNGWPRFLSQGKNPHYGTAVEHHVALFWEWVAEPLLFGLVGTAVDFHYINPSTIPKSLLVIVCGWAARCPATFFAVMGAGLTWKERLFVTLTWLPKATVQAVRLGGVLRVLSVGPACFECRSCVF